MKTRWSILYRGPLSSCNYACTYCPFTKARSAAGELKEDARRLRRFTDWIASRQETINLLFTPWGEALIHPGYQRALSELSHRPNIECVAIQTNLSCGLDWITEADTRRLAFWCTFHPGEADLGRFLRQCAKLDDARVRYSVGLVGTKEALPFLPPLRAGLNPGTYLWVNAFTRTPDYYRAEEVAWVTGYDPLFPINLQRHQSRGKRCRTGHTVFSVDGSGDVRRCHFVKHVLGNIYQPGFEQCLVASPCPVATCHCHVGYVHLEHLGLDAVFGDGLLPRVLRVTQFALETPARPLLP